MKIIISVTNDVVTDQRVLRTAFALHEKGVEVEIVGRELPQSLPVQGLPFKVTRFKMRVNRGFLFYKMFNLRLLMYLLRNRSDWLLANDLDTLAPNVLAGRLQKRRVFYDSHEYFTGVPELSARPLVRNSWKLIERLYVPLVNKMYTVNQSIALLYARQYRRLVHVIRNVPAPLDVAHVSRAELGLPEGVPIVIFQGAGINVDRGAEEAVRAMQFVQGAVLLVIGGGDVFSELKNIVERKGLQEKVIFKDKMPYPQLRQHTVHASIGLTLDKDTNLNYRYSLPNKLFDYIHSGIAVLASPVVEVKKIVEQYDVGMVINNHSPVHIAECINEMLRSPALELWKGNALIAAKELNWEKEKLKLFRIFNL